MRTTTLQPQTLRGYQTEAVKAIRDAWEGGESAPLAALATGAGKTTIIAQVLVEAIDPRHQRALVLGHTQEIIGQLYDRINQQFGGQLQQTFNTAHALFAPGLGIVMADRNEADARIVVATRQSLHAKRIDQVLKYGAFDVVVVDECFPAGTLVDGKPIESYRIGDSIAAYDETNHCLATAKVTHVFVKRTSQLVRIRLTDRELVCTPNHPILTRQGWKSAGDITPLDCVKITSEKPNNGKENSTNRNAMPYLRETCHIDGRCQKHSNGTRAGVLLPRMLSRISSSNQFADNGEYESSPRIGTNENQQSNEQTGIGQQDAPHAQSHELETARTGRQRARRNSRASVVGFEIGLANRVCHTDEGALAGIAQSLQIGHRQSRPENCNRSGWGIARHTQGQSGRPAQDGVFDWSRVESVEVLEQGSDGEFERLCPDGVVYNLEVTPHNTYIVNGVVVHNCHHALGENSYGDIIEAARAANPDLKILGVTATPKRTDEAALGSVFGKIVYQWLIPDGINGGYLVPVTRVKIKTKVDLSKIKSSQGDYAANALASALDMANWADLSVKAYQQYIAPTGRSTLAFMPSVEMSKRFTSALRQAGIAAEHIDGETDKEIRQSILRGYSAGRIQVVSNYGVLTEGFDAPRTAAIFMGRPTRSKTLFTQIIGRGLRPFAGKLDCLLVDMTVVDTKALNTGDLLGKMRSCPKCQADFYAGMRSCPKCGAPVERTKREILEEGLQVITATDNADSPFAQRGIELVASYESLFTQAMGAWYWDANGYMSLGLGFDAGTLVIVPPLLSDTFTLVRTAGTKDKPVIETVKETDDLQDIIAHADAYIRQNNLERLADKDAIWRNAPATPAQIGLLTTLGETVGADISKGDASKLISHKLSVKRVLEAWGA